MSRLTEKNKNVCDLCGQRNRCIGNDCQLVKLYDKLKHYEDLEEQGRLIELPCNIGDDLYALASRKTRCSHRNREFDDYLCGGCDIWECDSHLEYYVRTIHSADLKDIVHRIRDFGESVFLTKQEADTVAMKRNEEILERIESYRAELKASMH